MSTSKTAIGDEEAIGLRKLLTRKRVTALVKRPVAKSGNAVELALTRLAGKEGAGAAHALFFLVIGRFFRQRAGKA
jgi:hypothetical protein